MRQQEDAFRKAQSQDLGPYDSDVDRLDANGKSPVHYAAEAGDFDALKALVEWGCDPLAQTGEQEAALDIGLDLGRFDICSFLLTFETEWDPRPNGYNALDYPAMQGDVAAIAFLLEHGAKVNGAGDARPPLVWAVQEGHFDAFLMLLKAGADAYRAGSEPDTETAMSMAAQDDRLAFLEAMLTSEGEAPREHILNAYETALAFGEDRATAFLKDFL